MEKKSVMRAGKGTFGFEDVTQTQFRVKSIAS